MQRWGWGSGAAMTGGDERCGSESVADSAGGWAPTCCEAGWIAYPCLPVDIGLVVALHVGDIGGCAYGYPCQQLLRRTK